MWGVKRFLSSCLWSLWCRVSLDLGSKGRGIRKNSSLWTCQINYFCFIGNSHSPVDSLTVVMQHSDSYRSLTSDRSQRNVLKCLKLRATSHFYHLMTDLHVRGHLVAHNKEWPLLHIFIHLPLNGLRSSPGSKRNERQKVRTASPELEGVHERHVGTVRRHLVWTSPPDIMTYWPLGVSIFIIIRLSYWLCSQVVSGPLNIVSFQKSKLFVLFNKTVQNRNISHFLPRLFFLCFFYIG